MVGILTILVAFSISKSEKSDFEADRELIVMRNIAHQILLYTGDSTSPVAPVVRVSPTEFNIPFESIFSFKPDSLVHIIDRIMSDNSMASKYVVNVRERKTNKVVYGYAVMGPNQKSIVPCQGRNEPAMSYSINIKFEEGRSYPTKGLYLGGSALLSLGLLLLVVKRKNKPNTAPVAEVKEEVTSIAERPLIPIGQYLFYPDQQLLKLNEDETILTIKEAKILSIFAHAPNQIIDRKRLQKEIWEDEGVIVGRSLDVFISRLRKKLENDEAVKLINIHGKGYKLEISTTTT